MRKWINFSNFFASVIIIALLTIKSFVIFKVINDSYILNTIEYSLIISLIFHILIVRKNLIYQTLSEKDQNDYLKKLNSVLITQSHSEVFYTGNLELCEMLLTREVAEAMEVDRVSIWLFNPSRSAIECRSLFTPEDQNFSKGLKLKLKDYPKYFEALDQDPIIIANNAESHFATQEFKEGYLDLFKIKAMLDVPIWYRGSLIGVICIESKKLREWQKNEVDFVQLIASLYSFAFSIKETNSAYSQISEINSFIDFATLVSKTDARGKITYVNKKFEEISGWTSEELIGKDHSIVNSGIHTKDFWKEMYRTTAKEKKIWHGTIANKNKNGEIYWVDSYIRAHFDLSGKVIGYSSIRNDITNVMESATEISRKNTYLEHAAKILRHDMHSGINTYIPRGISSLERRLTQEDISKLKLEAPLQLIKEGLKHAQSVYRGVYEFTDLVREGGKISKEKKSIIAVLENYLKSTAYRSQVILDSSLPSVEINESLFCTALDNLIRNGLKYNDSNTRWVKISFEEPYLIIEDNGRGLSQSDFDKYSKSYSRKEGQKEKGTGLGLNICKSILEEHEFKMEIDESFNLGTRIKIKIKNYD
jgi:PAS domain S-box-containing protein